MAFESLAGMCVTDSLGRILLVNQAFTTLTGYTEEEAVGQHMSLLSSGRHNRAFYQAMWAAIGSRGSWQGEVINRRKNGEIIAEWQSISAITNADGQVTHYTATFYDITANLAAQEQISHLAYFDPLTQLPNRSLLRDRLAHAVASSGRSGRDGAVMFIDLDNFKAVNDTMGHAYGDRCLTQVAALLSRHLLRKNDLVARLGGEEFGVILSHTDAAGAAAICETLRAAVAAAGIHHPLAVCDHRLTISIGLAVWSPHTAPSCDADALQQLADDCLYAAKRQGRNRVVVRQLDLP
jgi:diguanylate cyclase (GGDEF)-like protein/PAS domain S-box-containing protein